MPSVKKMTKTRRATEAALRRQAKNKAQQRALKAKVAKKDAKETVTKSRKLTRKQFTIDCKGPALDTILDVAAFEKYLTDRIKVKGKAGMLGDYVKVSRVESKIIVDAQMPFSKRYLKYLTKKFLKKSSIRDWLRVVADSKDGFTLKYFSIQDDGEEGSEGEAEE
eukprot:TRINITY_DN2216_c0_g1_i1.p1 TRINITY_DN2216_c0_g1~~TRINITY_DN2216_c0_g1_i1.p1  ORF type:complete len:165 (+),score=66.83 TRINITY_DN2216_c0_g1_i1:95-589(+)